MPDHQDNQPTEGERPDRPEICRCCGKLLSYAERWDSPSETPACYDCQCESEAGRETYPKDDPSDWLD